MKHLKSQLKNVRIPKFWNKCIHYIRIRMTFPPTFCNMWTRSKSAKNATALQPHLFGSLVWRCRWKSHGKASFLPSFLTLGLLALRVTQWQNPSGGVTWRCRGSFLAAQRLASGIHSTKMYKVSRNRKKMKFCLASRMPNPSKIMKIQWIYTRGSNKRRSVSCQLGRQATNEQFSGSHFW